MDSLFDGLGTSLIIFILGLVTGGSAGYKIGLNKVNKQSQKAGHNSTQIQVGDGNKARGQF